MNAQHNICTKLAESYTLSQILMNAQQKIRQLEACVLSSVSTQKGAILVSAMMAIDCRLMEHHVKVQDHFLVINFCC